MRQTYLRAVMAIGVLMLGACGGGGSSGGTVGSLAPDHSVSIAFEPTAVSVTSVDGLGFDIFVLVHISGSPADNSGYALQMLDPDGIAQKNSLSINGNSGDLVFALTTNQDLKPGMHEGTISIQACSHNCQRIDGVGKLNVKVTVDPATHLTTLQPLAGVADWQTTGGSASHRNYVPVTLDASKFNPRWILSGLDPSAYPKAGLGFDAPTTDSVNHIIVTRSASGIIAFDETDGTELWHIGRTNHFYGAPALYNGVVYVTSIDFAGNDTLSAYNDTDGSVVFSVATGTASDCVCDDVENAPVVSGGTVYVVTTNVQAFDAATGAPLWTGPAYAFRPVATDGAAVYLYEPNQFSPGTAGSPGFTALDPATGSVLWQVARAPDPAGTNPSVLPGNTPVLDGHGGAIVDLQASARDGGPIDRFDLAAHALAWETGFSPEEYEKGLSPLAVDDDSIYAATLDGGIAAISRATGAEKWRWYPVEFGVTATLVTKNLLFVAGTQTYAVDLATHKTVWTFPVGGFGLSISPSGILYLKAGILTQAVPTGTAIIAVNLH